IFLIAGVVPILISLILYSLIYLVFHIKRDVFYLLSLSTIFGSLAFFGIPFVIFVLPETEKIATLMAAFVSAVAVFISIAMLEFYRVKCVFSECLPKVFKKLSKNPLIISLFIGLFFSILDIPIPSIIKRVLDMFGKTTAVISMFMLGVFLQGKKYKNLKLALLLSMLRMFFLPFIALVISKLFYLSEVEIKVIVLMNAMPLAVSMIILSERYKFYEGVISSIILISSISSIIYLYFWLYIVGF
ncbi:MAG: AEC family transporter, partial [bacterium]|nr:AEC family transporter [bacterium]MDW8164200.1 AEC family transporter [Candidatus Omnitrophota bacterium]